LQQGRASAVVALLLLLLLAGLSATPDNMLVSFSYFCRCCFLCCAIECLIRRLKLDSFCFFLFLFHYYYHDFARTTMDPR
jgi:hypothetical protein